LEIVNESDRGKSVEIRHGQRPEHLRGGLRPKRRKTWMLRVKQYIIRKSRNR